VARRPRRRSRHVHRADIVADAHPGSFIQVGIAEQNMVGMAFGLSTLGYRPWVSSFGVFLTNRALDQVRMLVSQTKAPVRLAAAYSGLLNGASGKTHQDIQDFAIMRAMPNMTVLAPPTRSKPPTRSAGRPTTMDRCTSASPGTPWHPSSTRTTPSCLANQSCWQQRQPPRHHLHWRADRPHHRALDLLHADASTFGTCTCIPSSR